MPPVALTLRGDSATIRISRFAGKGSVTAMHHPNLNDILLAVACAIAAVGSVPLMRYAYKTCKTNTPFEQKARRVMPWCWALMFLWQSCRALRLPEMRSSWMDYGVPLLIMVSMPLMMLFLFVQTRMRRDVKRH
jgi:cytochrome bd-type quinol oxidase subunit 2